MATTKYNLHDPVYCLDAHYTREGELEIKIVKGHIREINISFDKLRELFSYRVVGKYGFDKFVSEDFLFSTTERDLIEEIFKGDLESI